MRLTNFTDRFSGSRLRKTGAKTDSLPESKTILLIDDEEIIIDICEMMLEKLGHQVFKASTGSEGLKIYEANKNQIDLIISDMNMPEMDGNEVVEQLRKIDHHAKVLLSSGGLSNADEEEILNKGFNGFMKKPFNIDILSEKMAEILN